MLKHHGRGPEGGDGIRHTLARDVEGGAVDRLEHGREQALRVQVGGRRDAEAAGKCRCQVGQDVGVQVGRDHHVQRMGLQHHARRHGVDQFAVNLDVRIVLGDFVEDLVPHHHAEALRVRLGHQGKVLAGALLRELKCEAVDPFDTGAREDSGFRAGLDGQATVGTAAVARVFAFRVLADDDPVDVLAIGQRALHPWQYACGAYVGVLVEALGDG